MGKDYGYLGNPGAPDTEEFRRYRNGVVKDEHDRVPYEQQAQADPGYNLVRSSKTCRPAGPFGYVDIHDSNSEFGTRTPRTLPKGEER